jgi:hypothetical protein
LTRASLDCERTGNNTELSMDALFLLLTLAFFAASAALVYGCERLRKTS